ncbi:hypothetical protein [Aquabacterium sp. OR-4]|uniref:hypothetical protein n=1 Tax=Aquabacterium sp. OR-4 TaxID=2978127 RepID=UPI0021B46F37|nr:hypothetical protein [Aquabacterium sp. OR-4]MDT7837829.1 hypothetical protein [Aquabacterium sp. OR-4]
MKHPPLRAPGLASDRPASPADGLPPAPAMGLRPPLPPVMVCADMAAATTALEAQLGRCRRQARRATVLWVQGASGAADDALPDLLQAMGQRLRHRVRASDGVLQVAAQGFVVLLADADAAAASGVCARLRAVLQGPYRGAGGRAAALLPLHLGMAVHGSDGHSAQALLLLATLRAAAPD